MTLQNLQDKLRTYIRARIARGDITGSALSREAGFQQGHLSNFLNSRRGLSVEAMDRLFETLGIGILDLVNPDDIQRHAVPPSGSLDFEPVVLISDKDAIEARFTSDQIVETRNFRKSFLRRLKPNMTADRTQWLRFVLLKLKFESARGLLPLEYSSATVLVDRHYISLQPYRRSEPNLYMVRVAGRSVIGYLSVADEHLIVRPHNPRMAVEVIRAERDQTYSDSIIGRICLVSMEV